MSDGRTHEKVAFAVAAVISSAAIPIGLATSPTVGIALTAGAVAGWAMTPDLDVDHRTHEERRIWRFSPVLGAIWTLYWQPYAWMIPHRSPLSHWPGVGTAIRMVYAFWWVPFVATVDPLFVGAMLCAWSVQDTFHWIWDRF